MPGQICDLISIRGPDYFVYGKINNTRTITHVCLPVLLFILIAQKHVCHVTYETDSFVI